MSGQGNTPAATSVDNRSNPGATIPSTRSLRAAIACADHVTMEIARLADSDRASLASRVARITAGLTGGYVVLRATLWYTGRPPMYTAVVKER